LALSRQLAAQSVALLDEQLDLALLLSLEANRLTTSATDRRDLLVSLEFSPLLSRFLYGHTEPVFGVTFSPDGQLMASAGQDGAIPVIPVMGWIPRISIW
jgi:WD40 repeat protein